MPIVRSWRAALYAVLGFLACLLVFYRTPWSGQLISRSASSLQHSVLNDIGNSTLGVSDERHSMFNWILTISKSSKRYSPSICLLGPTDAILCLLRLPIQVLTSITSQRLALMMYMPT